MKTLLIRSKTTDSAVFKVAETLHQNGYEVHLLAWNRQNNLNIDDHLFKIHEFKLKAPYDKFSALFYLPFWWVYELYFLLKNNFDIVHACDLDTLYPAIIVTLIKRNKLFYTIYDFYANNLPYCRPFVLTENIRKIVTFIEKFGIGHSEVLFLTDERRYDEIKGAKVKKVEYIYNSPEDCKPNFNENLKKGKVLSLFYGGAILKQRGLEYIIAAIKKIDDVSLTIAGIGPDLDLIKKLIDNDSRIRYIGWLPSYNDILKNTIESDIIFRFADPKVPRTKYDSPNKLFEAMMCGKPIIMNSEMGISDLVIKEKCGIVLPYGDVESLKDAINKLKKFDLRHELGLNGRHAYETKFNWSLMEKRLLDIYDQYKGD